MNDLISRQAAIDAIDRLNIPEDMCVFEILSHIELEIGTLPSAQLIQCKECVYGNKMKDTIRCELMDYLPVECDHFCSWAERGQDG